MDRGSIPRGPINGKSEKWYEQGDERMKEGMRNKILYLMGWVFLVFWVVFTIVQFSIGKYAASFWFCNVGVIFLAVACFQRSLVIFYFFLSSGIIFQTPWILDWVSYFFFDFSFLDLAGFYEGASLFFMVLTFARHTLSVPIAIGLLFLFKPLKRIEGKYIWLWILGIVLLMMVSYLMPLRENANCAHVACVSFLEGIFSGFGYFVFWTGFVVVVSLVSLFVIVKPLHRGVCWLKRC